MGYPHRSVACRSTPACAGEDDHLVDGSRLDGCGGHHRLVHEGGYAIRKDYQGRWYFMPPDGRAIPQHGYQPDDMIDEGLDDGLEIDTGGASAEAPDHWHVPPGAIGVREIAPSYALAR